MTGGGVAGTPVAIVGMEAVGAVEAAGIGVDAPGVVGAIGAGVVATGAGAVAIGGAVVVVVAGTGGFGSMDGVVVAGVEDDGVGATGTFTNGDGDEVEVEGAAGGGVVGRGGSVVGSVVLGVGVDVVATVKPLGARRRSRCPTCSVYGGPRSFHAATSPTANP